MNRRLTLGVSTRISAVLLVAVLLEPLSAQQASPEELWLKITSTGAKRRLSLAIAPFAGPAAPAALDSLQQLFVADLRFSLYFTFQTPESGMAWKFSADPKKTDLAGWATTGAEVLICGDYAAKGAGASAELRLYDLATERKIAAKAYAWKPDWRWLAHEMADDVIKLLTGEDGVSRTRIAFTRVLSSDTKELAVFDRDGANLRQVTNTGGVKLFPDWSGDGRRIAYSSYGKRSLNIYTCDPSGADRRTVCEHAGLNTTPAWSPDSKTIAASLSFEGQSEIYLVNPDGSRLRRLTNHRGIDISPSWSPTGRQLAFVSDRTGAPQVYVMNADGTDSRRVTFEGSYNTSPAWSPRGDMIAFIQRQPDGSNQVCVTNISGDSYMRLTSHGNNEDPCWSPDGMHLAFSSNRAGGYEIYTMDWNGGSQTRLTRTAGSTSPTWSPRLR